MSCAHSNTSYLYSVQTSNFATWSGFDFKANVEVVLFTGKWENLIKKIWWLSVTSIAWGNHLGSLSYWQLVSMSYGMQLFYTHLDRSTICQTSKFIVFLNTSVVFLNINNKRHKRTSEREYFIWERGAYFDVFFLFSCINTVFFSLIELFLLQYCFRHCAFCNLDWGITIYHHF